MTAAQLSGYTYSHGSLGSILPNYIYQHSKGFWNSSFYRLNAIPVSKPTASKHWRLIHKKHLIMSIKGKELSRNILALLLV